MALMAMTLKSMGYKAKSLLGYQAEILTDSQSCAAGSWISRPRASRNCSRTIIL
ncbi:MAG: hypothetical protein R2860_07210 [Desulfobacterales bacterium]